MTPDQLRMWLLKLGLIADALKSAQENILTYDGERNLKKLAEVNQCIVLGMLKSVEFGYDRLTENEMLNSWHSLEGIPGLLVS